MNRLPATKMANKDKYFPIEKILDQRIQRGKVSINNNRYKRHRFHLKLGAGSISYKMDGVLVQV